MLRVILHSVFQTQASIRQVSGRCGLTVHEVGGAVEARSPLHVLLQAEGNLIGVQVQTPSSTSSTSST